MQWLPDTIDAVTRMYHETGMFGLLVTFVVVAIFVLVLAIILILTRHTGELVGIGKAFVNGRAAADLDIVSNLKAISVTSAQTSKSNEELKTVMTQVRDRVDKLPSDAVCKAKTREELIDIIRDAFPMMTQQEFELFKRQQESKDNQ